MTTDTRTDTLDLDAPFPVEWNAWRAQWDAYRAARDLPASAHRFDGVNFLADEVLGTFDTPTGPAELSEVTFPDLTGERRGRRVRYVGVTLATGPDAAGGIVSTFAELDRMLGLVRYWADGGYVYNRAGYVMSADAWDSTDLAERHGTYAELPTAEEVTT